MALRTAMRLVTLTLVCACAPSDDGHDAAPRPTIGHVERLDPLLDAIVTGDATFEVLADGHEWTEGPVWVPALQALLYSDVPRNTIYRWDEATGTAVWLIPSGYTGAVPRGGEPGSNGLALDAHGRLIVAQHGDRRIARLDAALDDPAPTFTTVTTRYGEGRYDSPNDLTIHSSGAVYFTDPPYGLEGGVDDPTKELPTQGVYRWDADGTVALLIDDLTRPNGIALSPDERTLYVANSDPDQPVIMVYDLDESGHVRDGRVFFDSWGDGMAVDTAGRVFVTDGRRGVLVLAPDGTHLGTLVTGERTANCTFGGDGSMLYVTADDYLLRIRLETLGVGF